MNKKKIGIFIKEKRIKSSLTQDDLANKLHVDRTVISKWERGIYPIGTEYLLKLSEILKVSVNEILASEEKQVENEEYIDNFSIQVIENSKKMQKRIIKYFVLIILVLCLLFFIYYFISTYNKIRIYYFSLDGDNFYMEQSLAFFSNNDVYIKFGDIESKKDEYEIDNVEIYYAKENGERKFVFSSDNINSILYQQRGYDEYFSFSDIDCLIDSLYADIYYYDSGVEKSETVTFDFNRIYINNNLIFKESESIGDETKSVFTTSDIPSKILETFDIDEDGIYTLSYSTDDKEIYLFYEPEAEWFVVFEKDDDYVENFSYHKVTGYYDYSVDDTNNSTTISLSDYEDGEIICLSGSCDDHLERYNYFIEKYIKEYFVED